ncbi:hypothetical protein GCM10023189_37720 [Nibrella saemangeumensis]|uniref:Proteinase inhibitor I42 chagasin domain-containing protein n=1 Tax=Nibrella saemangeumensis TaxID=1084526 RepID=A0ABP8N5R7_9BACT
MTGSAPVEALSKKTTGDQKTARNTARQKVYTYEDNQGVAFVKKDSPLIIELVHTGRKGYRWVIYEVYSSYLKVNELTSIDNNAVSEESNERSYPIDRFTFQASKLGTTRLRLHYSQSANGSNPALKYELEVRILDSQKEVNKARKKYLKEGNPN